MSARAYQICTSCAMDTTDPAITFDDHGVCNHCHRFREMAAGHWHPNPEGRRKLRELVDQIKRDGQGKDYDVIIGVSGGVDSSYMLHLLKAELGLRPLALHVDAGWNSELAVSNIEKIVKKLDIDLYTHVVDWPEMRDLQLAYLKSGVANQDVPQDHIFAAEVLRFAMKTGARYIANGSNLATEGILPISWGHDASDSRQLKAIHKRYGTRSLKRYKPMSFWTRRIYLPLILKITVFQPLNLMEYSKVSAMDLLTEKYGWVYYGGKHYESRWTKFFQSYFLPRRFGYDKRRAHLASLVVAGEISREVALEELKVPPYDPVTIEADIEFVTRKLGISRGELENLMQQPLKSFADYPNEASLNEFARSGLRSLARIKKAIT